MPLFLSADERNALRRVITLLRIRRGQFLLALLLGCLALGSAVSLAATSAWLIARASEHPPVLHLTVAAVSVRMFGVSRAFFRYLHRLASHRVAMDGMDHLRQGLYAQLAHSPVDRTSALHRGDILVRAGADVDAVGDFVVKSLLPVAVTSVVSVGTVVGLAFISPSAALLLGICLIISGVITPLLMMRAHRDAETLSSQSRSALAATIQTVVDSAPELQVSGRLAHSRLVIAEIEGDVNVSLSRSARIQGFAAFIDRLAMGGAVIAALAIGIPATFDPSVALPGVLLAVLVLTPLSAFEGTSELSAAAAQLLRSAQAAVRIDAILGPEIPGNTTFDLTFTQGSQDAQNTAATSSASEVESHSPQNADFVLDAQDLAIGWPNGPILAEGITVRLQPGRRLAIVGPSGIGKTTLLLTLAGLLPPKSGDLTLNGTPLSELSRSTISQAITVTTEDAHVFATTILENLRVANAQLSVDEAWAYLETVGLASMVRELPAGLETTLGTGGTTISGGERRRLLTARALASPSPLIAVDEASEHLDARTGDALLRQLYAVSDTRGIIIVTHRLNALDAADTILVLDRPEADRPATVLAQGTHQQLLAENDSYRWAVEQETADHSQELS